MDELRMTIRFAFDSAKIDYKTIVERATEAIDREFTDVAAQTSWRISLEVSPPYDRERFKPYRPL
jgi:hypothetical protein